MSTEHVAAHYSEGGLLAAIEQGLRAAGKSPGSATIDDLAPVDEFHIGGRPATVALCAQLGIGADTEVLDIGCGIGGTARFIASAFAGRVTGIDLTDEYVEVARELSDWTGLGEMVAFETGSALATPFGDDSFDAAVQLHVGMNIEDKAVMFEEVFRVVRPGGRFGVYDVMRMCDDEHDFPVPWAGDPSISFVDTPAHNREALEAAGFVVTTERDRGSFAVGFFDALESRAAERGGPPPLGLHLIMGSAAPTKIANMIAAVRSGTIAPVEFVCEKPVG